MKYILEIKVYKDNFIYRFLSTFYSGWCKRFATPDNDARIYARLQDLIDEKQHYICGYEKIHKVKKEE